MFISSWEITQSVFWQNTDMDVAGKGGKVRKAWISLGKLLSLSTSLLEIQQNLLTLVELLLRFSHPIFWSKR